MLSKPPVLAKLHNHFFEKAVVTISSFVALVVLFYVSFLERWLVNSYNPKSLKSHAGSYQRYECRPPLLMDYMTPEDSFDPNSEYFGIIYKHLYGAALCEGKGTNFSYAEFTKNIPNWIQFFPKLEKNFAKFFKQNPNKDPVLFTNNFTLSSKIANSYHIGDTFTVTIQVKNSLNKNKTFGGDYLRARLIKDGWASPLDGIPCVIEDHSNGTYTVKAPLPADGRFALNIILVLSVEGVYRLAEWSAGRINQSELYHASLASNEKVLCSNDLIFYDKFKNDYQRICDYSNPRNGEPWFCEVRLSNICYPIFYMETRDFRLYHLPFNINLEMEKVYKQYKINFLSDYIINVKSPIKDEYVDMSWQFFPHIHEDVSSHDVFHRPSGYSNNGQWISFEKNYSRTSLEECIECFRNKVVYMLGDSTIRQFYLLAAEKFHLGSKSSDGDKVWSKPRVARNSTKNITLYYRGHGPPFRNLGPPRTRPYISDVIDGIKVGGSNVVVIINLGLHFLEYESAFYIHRLKGIRTALIKHLKRFSRTKFIIKGMNVTEFVGRPFEWLIYRCNVLLQDVFKNLNNVVFVDLWGMTTLWPLYNDNHPIPLVLEKQALHLFNQVCHQ